MQRSGGSEAEAVAAGDDDAPGDRAPGAVSPDPARRRPGRPVSAVARESVLTAAGALLDEAGWAGFSIDEVSRRTRVSKSTIYRHWSGGFALATEALGRRFSAVGMPREGEDPADELLVVVERLAAAYAGPSGELAAQLIGASVSERGGPATLEQRFFGERRAATERIVARAIALGELDPAVTPRLVVDQLFGPIVFRLFSGLGALPVADAVLLARRSLAALRPPSSPL